MSHPEITSRLAEDMAALARLIDTAPGGLFLDDSVFLAGQHLLNALEPAVRAVEAARGAQRASQPPPLN